jgi:hypothetical protein
VVVGLEIVGHIFEPKKYVATVDKLIENMAAPPLSQHRVILI